MRIGPEIRRVIIVVLDGLRPDAIEKFDLAHIRRLMSRGAATTRGTTVAPSITTAAMTSLLTGASPARHGITTDRFLLPSSTDVTPIPAILAAHGYPSAAFMGDVPTLFRSFANRVGRRLGFGTTRFAGKTAPEIMLSARSALRTQRRGLIMFHWPDADRAGHQRGWMSAAYEEACHALDGSLGMVGALAHVDDDYSTLLIACADHGGGGFVSNDHNSDHPLDRTIPVLLAGPAVAPGELGPVTLLDIAPTTLWALGIQPPPSLEGRVLDEAFATAPADAAVA
ncbi:MAG TPA: alkaline phosphatase family protein [Gemmatimonadaceae bacterium]|jgi:predicted AlkP superfamily pyrophosphatase or phosphodiesterase|nr:alkaline phosphatase family protein [Gemmatimonadaceae bacterium]